MEENERSEEILYHQDASKRLGLGPKREKTLARILDAALDEFEQKGFLGASLRNIVKTAGVTTGAFYSYFDSKEELFAALTARHYYWMLDRFEQAQQAFTALPDEDKPSRMNGVSSACIDEMLEYAYEYPREVRLLLVGAEGTSFEHMKDMMIDAELLATCGYLDMLKKLGQGNPRVDMDLVHIIITGMFNAFFEIIIHQMPREEAAEYLRQLKEFYFAGWARLLGMDAAERPQDGPAREERPREER